MFRRGELFVLTVGLDEEDDDEQEDKGDADRCIGDVKSPPAIKMITENINIEKIEIEEIDDTAMKKPVNYITDSTAGYERKRIGDNRAEAIGVDVVENEQENKD